MPQTSFSVFSISTRIELSIKSKLVFEKFLPLLAVVWSRKTFWSTRKVTANSLTLVFPRFPHKYRKALPIAHRRHQQARLRLSSQTLVPLSICRLNTINPGFSPKRVTGGPLGVSSSSSRQVCRHFSPSTLNAWSPKLSVRTLRLPILTAILIDTEPEYKQVLDP